jgi:anti-sigma B factor antagonist
LGRFFESRGLAPGRLIVLSGELDVSTAPRVVEGTSDALLGSRGPLVLDLRALEFIDSTGCRTFAAVRRRCDKEGRRYVVICPASNDDVYRVLEILGPVDILDVVDDLPPRGVSPAAP